MNALTPHPQSAPPAKATTPELTTGLSLLLSHDKLHEAADEIAKSPALWRECQAALPAIQRAADTAMAPAGDAQVARIIGRRLAVYPQPDRSEDEWIGWWEAYYDALSDLPARALDDAMRDWVRSPAQFLPKPGELRELARTKLVPEYRMLAIARAAMRREPMTLAPEEVAERKAQVADVLSRFAKPEDVA